MICHMCHRLLRVQRMKADFEPDCPKCASYALYRETNRGNYECQTCGLQNIEEQIARMLM